MNFFILAFNHGIIDVKDYQKAEQYIADKYGLTDGNAYRRIKPFDENLYWKSRTHKEVNIVVQLWWR